MMVSELIAALELMPQDVEVRILSEGAARVGIDLLYLSKRGDVVAAEYGEICHYEPDIPRHASLAEERHIRGGTSRFYVIPRGCGEPILAIGAPWE